MASMMDSIRFRQPTAVTIFISQFTAGLLVVCACIAVSSNPAVAFGSSLPIQEEESVEAVPQSDDKQLETRQPGTAPVDDKPVRKTELNQPEVIDSSDKNELPKDQPVDKSAAGAEAVKPEPKKYNYEYKKIPNVTYSKGQGYSLLCDIYQPIGDGPFPALLAIHGGAWTHGSKLNMIRHAWKLARAGYVVVAINYRHAPQYKFPAQVHDCKQAVRWIRSKQEKLKIDPNQIAVFGYSAGGHLGAMLGSTDGEDGLEGPTTEAGSKFSSRVHCVVVGGGPCEFSWIKSRALVHWLGDSPQNNPEVYKQAAPLTYVTPDDPPFIFFHGGDDGVVPLDSAKKMHSSLQQAGIESQFHTVGEKGHLATFTDTGWLDQAIEFMDEKLKRTHHE